MSEFAAAASYLWSGLFIAGWVFVGAMHLRSAWTGRFFWGAIRRTDGEVWPPSRSERPLRFWLLWLTVALPFVFLPLLIGAEWISILVGTS